MRWFGSEERAKVFVLGLLALIGICAILVVVGITTLAVIRRPRSAGTPEPWVATGLAEMATYQFEQTAAASSGLPTPTVQSAASEPAPVAGGPTGKIVYTCFIDFNDDLCLMNADGSNVQHVITDPNTDWYAALSPDGQLISFSSRRTGSFEAYLVDLTGANVQQMTQSNYGEVYAPEISPDGTRLLFVSTANGKQDIYVMALDGSGVTRLTDNPADDIDPTWSPDGMRISFSSNRTGTNELYIMNADGSNTHQVTSGGNQREGGRNDWSPDGEWIAFYAGVLGNKNIFMVPTSCADQPQPCGPDQIRQVTHGGNNKAPSFSPDGEWIAFASEEGGNNDIWIMRLDGTALRQLTNNPYAEWQPRWGP